MQEGMTKVRTFSLSVGVVIPGVVASERSKSIRGGVGVGRVWLVESCDS